jgi:hypothetical protein
MFVIVETFLHPDEATKSVFGVLPVAEHGTPRP